MRLYLLILITSILSLFIPFIPSSIGYSFFLIALSFGLGGIPFGSILTKIFLGKNIQELGSGNIGATNVLRVGNKTLAAATLFLDALKGFAPVAVATYLDYPEVDRLLIASAAILGHVFSPLLHWKGGKGVATTIGALLGLHGSLGGATAGIWALTIIVTKISSLGALISMIALPILTFFFHSYAFFVFGLCTAAFIGWTHRENIKRLMQGTES